MVIKVISLLFMIIDHFYYSSPFEYELRGQLLFCFVRHFIHVINLSIVKSLERSVITYSNKAIRDGKYLAPPHASAWQRSPH